MRTPADIMEELAIRVTQPGPPGSDIRAAVRFDIAGEHRGSWMLQLNHPRSVTAVEQTAKSLAADCTFRLNAADFVSLFEGKVTGQQLFFDGRLEVDGDLTMTLKLPAITRLLNAEGFRSGRSETV